MTRKTAVFLAIATIAMLMLSACGTRTADMTRGRVIRRNTVRNDMAQNRGAQRNGMNERDRDGFVDTNRDGRQDGIVRDGVVRENDRRHDTTTRHAAPRQGNTLPHRQATPYQNDSYADANRIDENGNGTFREDRMARDNTVTGRHNVTPRNRFNNRANDAVTPRTDTAPSATMAPRQGYTTPRAPGAAPRVAQSPAPGARNATPMRPL